MAQDFSLLPGPEPQDGTWNYKLTVSGIFAASPLHPPRFMNYTEPGWWKIVVPVEDE